MKELALKYGWEPIATPNDNMISFHKYNLIRLNIYQTTGTVTFQNMTQKYDRGETYRNVDIAQFERLLKSYPHAVKIDAKFTA